MNIAFLAPEFLQRLGGGTTYVSHTNYLIPGAERITKQQKKPQMNADERKLITLNNIKVSIIVCTYSKKLFSDTLECINSVKIISNPHPGLSEARNLGIKNAGGDVIVFIDDDARADKNYISALLKNYEDKNVVGVSGKILPKVKPNYPEELYWIGGFTYKGFPEERCEVRNGHGCNMSFRKEVFDKAGLFDVKLGRVGKKLVTAEETEFSIRALNSLPGSKIIYDPSVVVYHKVHEYRQGIGYMMKRGYFEEMSKAHIEGMYKGKNGGTKALVASSVNFTYIKLSYICKQ